MENSPEKIEDIALKRAKDKVDFLYHLVVFVIVNFFLFCINALTSPGAWWFVVTIFGWGIGLTIHGISVFIVDGVFDGLKDRMYKSELKKLKDRESK